MARDFRENDAFMDLRTYPGVGKFDRDVVLSLWWYQPYFFADDLVSGIAGSWFIKGLNKTVIQKADHPRDFERFWRTNERLAAMYQDWINTLCEHAPIDITQASVLDVGCNTGYFLFSLRQRGARCCLGIDQSEFDCQRSILADITNVRDIEFRRAKYSSVTHTLESLGPSDSFDIVIAVFVAQHLSDPLHFIRELSRRTRKILLFDTVTISGFLNSMAIKYIPYTLHHEKWGEEFPNNFDTWVSRGLVLHSLKECGFTRIVRIGYRRSWLPRRWYWRHMPVVCVR